MMNVIRKLAVATILAVAGAPLAGAADKDADRTITGEITPGVYGRVDMSKRAAPSRLYEYPMMVEAPRDGAKVEPLYLHVPPEHAKNWKKHCKAYDACSLPVFFVKSAEYEPGYTPAKPQPEEGTPGKAKRKFRSGW